MKHLVVPMEIKAVDDKGIFSGYASIFGNEDLGGDTIVAGAFKQIVKNKSGKVVTLYQHDGYNNLPIGLSDVEQDEKGLKFAGELVMDDPFVQRVHTHMKAKTLDGMSIGYDVLPGGAEWGENGRRTLSKLKLWEISVVVFGMNPKARISTVKSVEGINTIREFEEHLRDAGGFSHAQAKAIASASFKAFQGHRDDGDMEAAAAQLQRAVDSIVFPEVKFR